MLPAANPAPAGPEGFDWAEAQEAIALCGVIEQAGPLTPGEGKLVPPPGWDLIFDSPPIGSFDNKWQLWRNGAGKFCVAIRGTVAQVPSSVIEDLLAVMIPAAGLLPIKGGSLKYQFAEDPGAAVHLGFAVGALILLFDAQNGIIPVLFANVPGGSEVIFTGHSQGGAIVTLVRSFLHFGFEFEEAGSTYAFAQPKPGNDHYAHDVERIPETYRITNPLDWVPQVPLSIQGLALLDRPNPLSVLPAEAFVHMLAGAIEGLISHVAAVHLAKFLPQLSAVDASAWPAGMAGLFSSVSAPPNPPIVGGFCFVAAGVPVTVPAFKDGAEIPPPVNPVDPSDNSWQHHASTYAALMWGVRPGNPAQA